MTDNCNNFFSWLFFILMQISGSAKLTENIIHFRWLYGVLSLQAEFSIARPVVTARSAAHQTPVSISSPNAPCYLFKLSTLSPSRRLLVGFPFEVYLQSGVILNPDGAASCQKPQLRCWIWTSHGLTLTSGQRDYISYKAIRSPQRSWKSLSRSCLCCQASYKTPDNRQQNDASGCSKASHTSRFLVPTLM